MLESTTQLGQWKTNDTSADLMLPTLNGAVDFARLNLGIGQLVVDGNKGEGRILGVSAGANSKLQETIVRGGDLVVACSTEMPTPFQWQAYWRTSAPRPEVAQIDLLVSLQTPTLESYPTLATCSVLEASGILGLSQGKQHPQPLDAGQQETVLTELSHCLVLRNSAASWSYVEMTLPEDQAVTTLSANDGVCTLERKLGGGFLEKGVIRRMCLRGLLLPRENDLETAASLFQQFCAEEPPLTT